MKEYEVSIVETLKKTVTVEAESPEDAKYQVQKAWGKGEYILDADDFSGLEFELSPYQVDMPYHEMTKLFPCGGTSQAIGKRLYRIYRRQL